MKKYFSHLTNLNGVALQNLTITVKDAGTNNNSTIYSDNGVTTATQPLVSDVNGYFEFYAADGRYDLVISGAGYNDRTITDILLEDQVEGADVQAWSARLDDISALAVTNGNIIVGDGTNWVVESGATARTSLGLGTGDSPVFTSITLNTAFFNEQAAASADVAGDGQFWVKAATPNQAWFTDDAGTDILLSGNASIFYADSYGFATTASAATNTTAMTDAISAANAAGGGIVQLPAGIFPMNAFTVTNNNILIQGASGMTATTLSYQSTTGNMITFNGGLQYSGIQDVRLSAKDMKSTSGAMLNVAGDSFQCTFRRIRIEYAYDGILVQQSNSCEFDQIQLRYLVGNRGIRCAGAAGQGIFGYRFAKVDADNPYQAEPGGNIKTWATSTAFSQDDVVKVNGEIWQCTTAGTSAGSGSGPSGVPGTDNENAFTTGVTDGTVIWTYICEYDLIWFYVDNYTYSGSLDNSALLNGNKGLFITDAANTGTSLPKWFSTYGLEIDHSYDNCVELSRGEGTYFNQGWFGSSLTARGVLVGTNFGGEVLIDGCRIVGHRSDGILLQSGPQNVIISDNFIAQNDQGAAATNGITVGANASNFSIMGNHIGRVNAGTGGQDWGVIISAGTSDYYVVSGNVVEGNAIGGIFDAGTGVNKHLVNNAGFNPVGSTAISVTASPFTHTNSKGFTQSVQIIGGTVSEVTLNGSTVAGATDVAIVVPHNQSLVVTYSSAPTMTYLGH